MFARTLIALCLGVLLVEVVDSANILIVFPAPSKSHAAVGRTLASGLTAKGHHVTLVSPFPYSDDLNVETVILTGAVERLDDSFGQLASVDEFDVPIIDILPTIIASETTGSNFTLSHPAVRTLMVSRTFDLVIVDFFVNEATLGLGQHFGAPVIAVSSFGAHKWVNDLVGTPSPLSYVPHAFSTFADRMSLTERLANVGLALYENALLHWISYPQQRRTYAAAFPHARFTYVEAMANVSLVLLNSHFSINAPRPYVPNMIEVGGLHVQRTVKPLPVKLQQFLDTAPPEGVIYFSLGSFVPSDKLSAEHVRVFLRVFASLPQRVIWKFESERDDWPSNVLVDKWLPQNEILAHPMVRAFISHGGLLSTTEAVFHGVPVIGMPLIGDQMRNVRGAVQAGWAVQLDYANVTEASLRWALAEVRSNKVREAVRQVSERYRDQPLEPLQTALYWIEYVLRHRGAPHLRSASMELNLWQYHLLDVGAILGGATLLVVGGLVVVVRLFWGCVRNVGGVGTRRDRSKKIL